jgi:uncharacterized membrane protein YdcZ (DUF606 family)
VVSVGLFIAGQVLASIALDVLGLLGVPATGLSAAPATGAALVLGGAVLIVLGQQDAKRQLARSQIGWIALALAAGAVLPVQGAVNALLRHDLDGAAFAVGTVSFVVATLAMGALQIATSALPGASGPGLEANLQGLSSLPWWGWLGGFCRRDLRDDGVRGDPGDRRCGNGGSHGGRPAGGIGAGRQVRLAAAAATPGVHDAARRRRGAARGYCRDEGVPMTPAEPRATRRRSPLRPLPAIEASNKVIECTTFVPALERSNIELLECLQRLEYAKLDLLRQ